MGSQLKCQVRFGKQKSEGQALLETNEIIFRGAFRLKIPFSEIQSAKVVKDSLHLRTAGGIAHFDLGAKIAAKWCDKILHPKSRIEKLGVKSGAKVALIGFTDSDEEFLNELRGLTQNVTTAGPASPLSATDCIFLRADTPLELPQISKITKSITGATALWIVFPKGQSKINHHGQQKITEGDVLSAGRATGLKDVKVVAFSPTHTALKFVIPLSQR